MFEWLQDSAVSNLGPLSLFVVCPFGNQYLPSQRNSADVTTGSVMMLCMPGVERKVVSDASFRSLVSLPHSETLHKYGVCM